MCFASESGFGRCGRRYGLTYKLKLPAVADLIMEARLVAQGEGRKLVIGADLKNALFGRQLPSDQAMHEAFTTNPAERIAGTRQAVAA